MAKSLTRARSAAILAIQKLPGEHQAVKVGSPMPTTIPGITGDLLLEWARRARSLVAQPAGSRVTLT